MYEEYKSTIRYKGAGEKGGASNGCLNELISAHPRYKGLLIPLYAGGVGWVFLFNCVLSGAAYSDCAVQSLTHLHMLLVTCSTRDVDAALHYELETTTKLAAASALTCLIFT
jgi:hypothetical protein